MKRAKGLTIIQLMLVLFVIGIVGWAAVKVVIDKRCELDPASKLCAGSAPGGNK